MIRTQFQRILDLKGASKTTFEVRRVARIASDPRTGKFHLVKIHHQPRTDGLGVIGELNRFRESAADERTLTGAFGEPVESMVRRCPDEGPNTDSHAAKSESIEPNRVSVKANRPSTRRGASLDRSYAGVEENMKRAISIDASRTRRRSSRRYGQSAFTRPAPSLSSRKKRSSAPSLSDSRKLCACTPIELPSKRRLRLLRTPTSTR